MHALLAVLALATPLPADPAGTYRSWLECPGGELPFGLEISSNDQGLEAWIVNGSERIAVPRVTYADGEVGLHFDHYDSRITASFDAEAGTLTGTWNKRRGLEDWTNMSFAAVRGDHPRFLRSGSGADSELGDLTFQNHPEFDRWSAKFESGEDPAVFLLKQTDAASNAVEGSFLTTTGDYRFLAGNLYGDQLSLSCFDGAHAFLFKAERSDAGFAGGFWSRDTWHETWTAVHDNTAQLPDAFKATSWDHDTSLADLVFPDLDGVARSLADPAFAGKARLLQVFGTWCPNCYDETKYLVELHERYGDLGLSIVGLAFELTGDFNRDAEQVRVYREHHGIEYPVLVAGLSNKDKATAAFPALDRVRSYPTTIFMDSSGIVRKVHTGFTGPGTGAAYRELRREFEETIEGLLEEVQPSDDEPWEWLVSSTWVERGDFTGAAYKFHEGADGERVVTVEHHGRQGAGRAETRPVTFQPGAIALGEELWRVDRHAGVLINPFDLGRRISPNPTTATPLLAGKIWIEDEAGLVSALRTYPEALVRREAVWALARLRRASRKTELPEALALLSAPELDLRRTALWAVGHALEIRAAELLLENLEHPHAAIRRAAARSLAQLARRHPELATRWADRPPDPDPLVQAALGDG